MRYDYFRCENCKALITRRLIKEKGKCPKCGKAIDTETDMDILPFDWKDYI